jgi:hypothetical protein
VAAPEGDVRLVIALGDADGAPARVEGIGERGGEYGAPSAGGAERTEAWESARLRGR